MPAASASPAGLGDGAGGLLVGRDAELVAGEGQLVEAEDLDRHRRDGLFHGVAVVVEHGADLAPAVPGDEGLTDPQRAAFDERGDDGASSLIEVRFQDERPGGGFRVGAQLFDVGDEHDRGEQVLDALPGGGRDLHDDGLAAPLFGDELSFHELLADPLGVGVFAVDLRDRDDDRDLGDPGVADRLDGLGHDTVVGGDDEDRDVGRLRAAGPHGGERLMSRGVDERDAATVAVDLVGADALGDPARFAGDDVRGADRVEERRLAVVDVTHDRHDRGARLEERLVFFFVLIAEECLQLELLFLAGLDKEHLGAEGLGDQLDHLVGEGLGAGDHLAGVQQEPHEVRGVAVELGCELLDRDPAWDHDLALRDRRVEWGQRGRRRRPEVFEVATTTLLATRSLPLGSGTTSGGPPRPPPGPPGPPPGPPGPRPGKDRHRNEDDSGTRARAGAASAAARRGPRARGEDPLAGGRRLATPAGWGRDRLSGL